MPTLKERMKQAARGVAHSRVSRGAQRWGHAVANAARDTGGTFRDGFRTAEQLTGNALSPSMAQQKRANNKVRQSEDKLAERSAYKILANADALFQQAHQPFENFFTSLPTPTEEAPLTDQTQLAHYLQPFLSHRDYNNPEDHADDEHSYIEKVHQQQLSHIEAIREYAADPSNAFQVAKTTLDGIYQHQRRHIVEYFDRAKLAIEDTYPDATNEDRGRLLGELEQRKQQTLETFDQQRGEQLSTAEIDKQKEATEKEYLRALILSWQTDAMLQRLAQRSEAGDVAMLEDEELDLSQVDLAALKEPIRTATGRKLVPTGDGNYTIETPGDTIQDFFYRRSPGHKPYADCLALAMVVKAQGSTTMNFEIGAAPRISDPEKRNKLGLEQAKRAYEAAIEAGFKPEDIKITVTLSEKGQQKNVTYSNSGEPNFQQLFHGNKRSLSRVKADAEKRRDDRLQSQGIIQDDTQLAPEKARDFRNQAQALRHELQDSAAAQINDDDLRQTPTTPTP